MLKFNKIQTVITVVSFPLFTFINVNKGNHCETIRVQQVQE